MLTRPEPVQHESGMHYYPAAQPGYLCKGICSRHAVGVPQGGRTYEYGFKRCSTCAIFVKWDGLLCPCCNIRLRFKSRNKKSKAKYPRLLKARK